MAFFETKCAAKLTAAATGIIDKDQLQALFDRVDSRAADESMAEAAETAGKKFVDQKSYEAFNQKRTALWNGKKKRELASRVQNLTSTPRAPGSAHGAIFKMLGKDVQHLSPAKALEAIPAGATESSVATRDNAASYRATLQETEKAWLRDSLKREKLDKVATNTAFDAAVNEAHERLNTTDPEAKARLPMTEFKKLTPGQQTAVTRVAELYDESLERMRQRVAAVGGAISKREGYMGEQTHVRQKIRTASTPGKFRLATATTTADRDAYMRDLTQWIDAKGTARNLVRLGRLAESDSIDPEKFSASLWEVFTSGVRRDGKGQGAHLAGMGGNIAAAAERARVLEFKNAASYTAYSKKYGVGSKWESMNRQIDHLMHTAATLHFFGPSARENFETVLERSKLQLREKQAKLREKPTRPQARQSLVDSMTEEQKAAYAGVAPVEVKSRFAEKQEKELRKEVEQWAKTNIRGPVFTPALNKEVSITGNGLAKMVSGNRAPSLKTHLEAIQALPELLKNSVLVRSGDDAKGDRNTFRIHRLLAPLAIEGEHYDALLTVKETRSGDLLYDHSVLTKKPAAGTLADDPLGKVTSSTATGQEDANPYASWSQGERNAEYDRTTRQLDELQDSRAMKYMDAYLGNENHPGNMTATKITNTVMAWNRLSMLGSAFFSNMASLYTHFLASRTVGVNMLQSSMGPLFTAVHRLKGDDFNSWVRRTGVQMSAQLGQTALDLTQGGLEPGRIIKNLENVFFNMTGLTPMINAVRASYVAGVANELAHNAGKAFADLPLNIRNHLTDYAIGSNEWDVLRAHAITKFDGWDVMASDLVRNAPDEAFHGIAGSETKLAVNGARLDLEAKLANLYRDGADYASVTHNLKTGLIMDDLVGHSNLMRLTTQFATFPMAHGQLVLQRALKSQSFPEFLFKTLGGLTISGMLTYELRELVKGQNPMADPDLWTNDRGKSAQAWGRYVAAGANAAGVGGIGSDLLFSQTYQSGRGSALQTLAGPTGSNATEALKLVYQGVETGKINGTEAMRWAQSNTPFVNAWFTRPLINYGLMYGLEEQLNPGVLRRMERAAAQNGAPYWAPPSEYANPSPLR